MIDREVYQAEELDCYLETLCAGQFSQHSFNLPETEQNLVKMILGISARACPACIDLGLLKTRFAICDKRLANDEQTANHNIAEVSNAI